METIRHPFVKKLSIAKSRTDTLLTKLAACSEIYGTKLKGLATIADRM